jgi:hypothetical protein
VCVRGKENKRQARFLLKPSVARRYQYHVIPAIHGAGAVSVDVYSSAHVQKVPSHIVVNHSIPVLGDDHLNWVDFPEEMSSETLQLVLPPSTAYKTERTHLLPANFCHLQAAERGDEPQPGHPEQVHDGVSVHR